MKGASVWDTGQASVTEVLVSPLFCRVFTTGEMADALASMVLETRSYRRVKCSTLLPGRGSFQQATRIPPRCPSPPALPFESLPGDTRFRAERNVHHHADG